jgi:hypothetical protein
MVQLQILRRAGASIPNPQQVLPLAIVAVEPMTSGDIEQAPRHGVQVTEPLSNTDLFTKSFTRDERSRNELERIRSVDEWAVNSPNPEITRKGIRLIGTAHNPEDGKNLNRQFAAVAPICRNSLS